MNEQQQIAETIRRQIIAGDRLAMMAWGATKLVALDANEDRRGGLMFQVCIRRQRFHKVIIELTHLDEYRVHIWGGRRKCVDGRFLESMDGCYFDNLVEVIDGLCNREHERLAA
ncbi:MAG: hypothetical protein ACYS7Y_20190 [Planctomycetota bacterium]|jgi:hypothetical protein